MCTLNLKFVMKQKVKISLSLSLFFLSLKQNFEFKKNATDPRSATMEPRIFHFENPNKEIIPKEHKKNFP